MEKLVLSLFLEKWHRELCIESKRLCCEAQRARARSRELLGRSTALIMGYEESKSAQPFSQYESSTFSD